MASALPFLAATLLLAPPVQKPSVSPVQPITGEPAIAPADVDTEAAATQPDPADPGAEPDPGAAPDPGAEAQPVDAEPGPDTEPAPDAGPAEGELPSWEAEPVAPPPNVDETDLIDEWGLPVAPPPEPKGPPKGAGLYAAAGGLFGVMITRQWVSSITSDDIHYGFRGNADRIIGLGVMGLAAGGGWIDGKHIAWKRDREGQPGDPKKRRIAGWTLFSIGMAGLVTDTVLYNLCYEQAKGPYTQLNGFSYTCTPSGSVVVIDFSTIFGALGIGLGMSAESQLKSQASNKARTEVSLAPYGGQGGAGLTLSGRF